MAKKIKAPTKMELKDNMEFPNKYKTPGITSSLDKVEARGLSRMEKYNRDSRAKSGLRQIGVSDKVNTAMNAVSKNKTKSK